MKAKLGIAITVLALAAAPALAQKVYIDYDTEADLEKYRTWAYKENADGKVQDPLMDERIVNGLINMLSQGRLDRVAADPDLWATYSTTTEQRTQYSTTSMGYGTGAGRYGRYGWGGGVGLRYHMVGGSFLKLSWNRWELESGGNSQDLTLESFRLEYGWRF